MKLSAPLSFLYANYESIARLCKEAGFYPQQKSSKLAEFPAAGCVKMPETF